MRKKWKVIKEMLGSSFRKRFKRDKGRSNFHAVFLGGKRYHRTVLFHFNSTWNLMRKVSIKWFVCLSEYYRYPCRILLNYLVYAI